MPQPETQIEPQGASSARKKEIRRLICLIGVVVLIHFAVLFVAVEFAQSALWIVPCASATCGALLSLLVWRFASQRTDRYFHSPEALEAFPEPVVVCDQHLQILACNQSTSDVLGCALEELVGSPLEIILQSAHSLVTAAAELRSTSGRLRMTGFRGDQTHMQLDVTWTRYEQSLEPRYLLVLSPVEQIQRSQRIYQSLLEGTVLTVGEGFFPNLCQRMADCFGDSVAFVGEFRGQNSEQASLVTLALEGRLQGAFAPGGMDIPWKSRLENGFVYIAENLASEFPSSQWIREFNVQSCLLVPIKDTDAQIIGVLGLMNNQPMSNRLNDATILSVFSARAAVELTNERSFSELETAQTLAEGATRTKTALLSTLSHEIRTLMTSILGFADYLECADGDARQSDLAIDAIRRSGKQLLEVIKNADEASSLDNAALNASVSCSPRDILAKAAAALRAVIEANDITLQQDLDALTPNRIETNPDRVHHVLCTMLTFAASRSHGQSLHLFAELEHGGIEFGVSDNGPALTSLQLKNFFDPLCVEHADDSELQMQLADCHHAARLLGGSLGVETSEDSGATIRLRLPLPRESNAPQPDAAPPANFLQGRRVLVIEDQPDNMQLLQVLLEDEGATVHCAEDGKQGATVALYALRGGRPYDLVLMDMQMPVMDGYEATRLLRNQDYDFPIIAVTANSMSGDRERSLLAGCDDYVCKPIDSENLMEALFRRMPEEAVCPETAQLNPV